MKNLRVALLSLALLMPAALPISVDAQAATPQTTGPTGEKNPVLAKVKGREIRLADVAGVIQSMPEIRSFGPEGFEIVLNILTNQALMEDAAASANINTSDPTYKKMLAAAQQLAEREVRLRMYAEKMINQQITEDKMRARFDALMKDFKKQEEVDLYHILLSSEEEAKAAIKELDKGSKFEDIAAAKSLDKASSSEGGSLGYMVKDMLEPEMATAVFKLRPGKYAKSPVKSASGWHVFYVKDRRLQPKPTFEKAKNSVRALVGQELLVQLQQKLQEQNKDQIFRCNPETGECITLAKLIAQAKTQQEAGA